VGAEKALTWLAKILAAVTLRNIHFFRLPDSPFIGFPIRQTDAGREFPARCCQGPVVGRAPSARVLVYTVFDIAGLQAQRIIASRTGGDATLGMRVIFFDSALTAAFTQRPGRHVPRR
jgi:hypothetical protein